MTEYKLLLPAMGEGVFEATITQWLKKEGDTITEDESVVEVATDKVDSDLPSPVSGTLIKILKNSNEIAKVGETIAILKIDTNENSSLNETQNSNSVVTNELEIPQTKQNQNGNFSHSETIITELEKPLTTNEYSLSEKYLSPLIKSIAKEENITANELESIIGTGLDNRITKDDLLKYIKNRTHIVSNIQTEEKITQSSNSQISVGNEIIQMDRMRKLIAENMINSKRISAHVTSFIETDVTNIVLWRNKIKDHFLKTEGEKLTFMPIFIWAIAKAIKDFPMINVSVEGDTIIKKKDINIGIATALPSGNLIVPVIKNADQYNLSGLAKAINDLAKRARENKLKPHEIQNGTYTITNIGSFGNLMGTPIIPQPQVAILAVGAIVKKPAVIETSQGDVIAIRHKMFMSHTYDHRVVDGALGGMFLKRVHSYLESFEGELK